MSTPPTALLPGAQRASTIESDRQVIETALGSYLANHPVALDWARRLVQASWRYLQARASSRFEAGAERDRDLSRSLLATARYVDEHDIAADQFAGRVPPEPAALEAVFQGRGNIRELMNSGYNFIALVLIPDVVGPSALTSWRALAERAGLDVGALEELIERALDHRLREARRDVSRGDLDPYRDVFKLPWNRTVQAHREMRVAIGEHGSPDVWSLQTTDSFLQDGGRFSELELGLSGASEGSVPWLDPRAVWGVDERHPWVQEARREACPLMTGLSGITSQYLMFDGVMSLHDKLSARLACIGYLLPIKAHSFHEIMAAAADEACPYDKWCDYGDLLPLTRQELESATSPTRDDEPRSACSPGTEPDQAGHSG